MQLDVIVTDVFGSSVNVLLGYGNGSFAKHTAYSTGSMPTCIAVADFNEDNRLDIVVANSFGRNVSVLLGYGSGSFANQVMHSTGSTPFYVAVGDFNGDTRLDTVVTNNDDNSVSVLLEYGNGSFANQTTHSTGSGPFFVAICDFNRDTKLDLFVTNQGDSNVSVLLGYDNDSFANQATHSTGNNSQPYSITIADFNNDTLLDIIVTNYDADNVVILIGHGNGTFEDPKVFSIGYGSFPFSVVAGDFNRDRKLDFAVANYGTDNLKIMLQNS
ncbi:unnamed protein product [Rotaria socialis]|uniref:VCBS repeat-containing protein n=1 Tax=Rotaria socialis TaxID=392032 RepID=A0A817Y8I2_9BILA|nr:unnamed protein product [Rotaria socialis]CAF4579495.1 unnamed protein product [Rotaria socialis]